jgi:hypothetical protein
VEVIKTYIYKYIYIELLVCADINYHSLIIFFTEQHHIVPSPGAGCLSHTVFRGQPRTSPHAATPTGQQRLLKTMTMQAEVKA